jgi:hypothetical protein
MDYHLVLLEVFRLSLHQNSVIQLLFVERRQSSEPSLNEKFPDAKRSWWQERLVSFRLVTRRAKTGETLHNNAASSLQLMNAVLQFENLRLCLPKRPVAR